MELEEAAAAMAVRRSSSSGAWPWRWEIVVERVEITSECFLRVGAKIEAKAVEVVGGGMVVETEMGRCWEKKEAMWMSGEVS